MRQYIIYSRGEKAEKNYIQIIYEHFYPDEYIQINRSDGKIINQDLINMPILDINWIENANINAFVEAIKFDEYGVSPVNYFKHKNDVKTYSEAYILVDADLKDKGSSSENAKEKIALLMELSEIVSNSDDNIEVLISSPMLECIGDNQDEYEYVSGESYKKKINKQFPSGVNGHFKANIEDVLLMNVKKYQNDDVDYSNQSLFSIGRV